MYSFRRFQKLPSETQIEQVSVHGIALDLVCSGETEESVLFAYNDFYIELMMAKCTDEILSLRCFRRVKKLERYLHQIDISEITVLLACSR